MLKRTCIVVLLLVIISIINIYSIGGEYIWIIPGKLTEESRVVMDKEGVLELEDISYSEEDMYSSVSFKAVSKGDVTVNVYKDEADDVGFEAELEVNRLLYVSEKNYAGSMGDMTIIRYEIILLLALMIFNLCFSIKETKRKNRYSYRLMFYMGAVIFLAINLIIWICKTFFSHYEGMTKLYSLYGDMISSFGIFAVVMYPFIILLAVFLIASNIALILREGKSIKNALGIALGIGLLGLTAIGYFSYMILDNFFDVHSYLGFHLAYLFESAIYVVLSYLECMMIGTYICSKRAEKHVPEFNKDYMIILGCSIRKDGTVTPLLKGRADRAIWFANKQKDATGKALTFVASGGQGADEVVSEAEAISNYLLENGIDEDHIIREDKSTNTYENMKFSYAKICEANDKKTVGLAEDIHVSFSTTGYHVFRSGNLADSLGIKATGVGSRTKWYFYTNALIREFIANMHMEKRKHIGKLAVLILFIFVFLLFSYCFKIL